MQVSRLWSFPRFTRLTHLTRFSCLTLAASACVTLPGCIIVADVRESDYMSAPVGSTQTANWASIRAARSITHSSDRREALLTIAQRSDLTQSEQLALVDVATNGRLYSSDATQVLKAIVNNSTTTIDTRNAIASNLRRADLHSSDRKAVTDVLIATTPATPPAAPTPAPAPESK
ncbi:hypothetical protein LBMAG48_21430 [Phycisphaerae bacterium]|nr:hypothetical protein LBMAG48_21430 [Phycisphaerae bacterium]